MKETQNGNTNLFKLISREIKVDDVVVTTEGFNVGDKNAKIGAFVRTIVEQKGQPPAVSTMFVPGIFMQDNIVDEIKNREVVGKIRAGFIFSPSGGLNYDTMKL